MIMGKCYESVLFVADDLVIIPHTASKAAHVGRKVTLRRFASGDRTSVERCVETGEYVFRRWNGGKLDVFAEGPAAD